MSSNGNGWKPRKSERLECPSGQVVYVKRPGPEFTLRAGRVARTFTAALSDKTNDDQPKPKSPEEIFGHMSDEELAAVVVFARELIFAMLVSPKLSLTPNPTRDEIGPEDIPSEDFWFLFNHGMGNFVNLKVPVGESEVEVKDLETFREDTSVSGDSLDSAHISSDTEQPVGDQGLVNSAGA